MKSSDRPVLQLLLEGEMLTTADMAEILNRPLADIETEIESLKEEGLLLGFRPVFNTSRLEEEMVRAVIEIRISPEREGGFDRVAMRVSQFEEVYSCYLMSGAYDLMVFVQGRNLHAVAHFVSEKLATLGGVLSTATHFMLRPYKENGFLLKSPEGASDKPAISP